jgi:hypothetical protein
MAYKAGKTKTTGKGLGRGMAPPVNYGNYNAGAWADAARKRGLDPRTWLPPGAPLPPKVAHRRWQHQPPRRQPRRGAPRCRRSTTRTIGAAKTQNDHTHAENLYQGQQLSNEYGIDDLSNQPVLKDEVAPAVL